MNRCVRVEVTLLNEFVVFGDNVTLICACDDYSVQGYSWTKGHNNTQLTLGVSSKDNEKYIPSQSEEGDRFLYILKIRHFSIMDLDYYNCNLGFKKMSYDLSLDNRFKYIPRNDEIISNVSHGRGSLNMTILIQNVYPDPICEMSIQGYNLTNKVPTIRKKSSKLYEAVLTSSCFFPAEDINCTIVIELNCILSTTQFYHRRHITICEENNYRSSTIANDTEEITMIIIPLVIISSLLTVVLSLVVIYKRKRKNKCFGRHKPSGRNQPSGRNETQILCINYSEVDNEENKRLSVTVCV